MFAFPKPAILGAGQIQTSRPKEGLLVKTINNIDADKYGMFQKILLVPAIVQLVVCFKKVT